MPLLADDKYYMDMVATAEAKSELHQYWKLWGLENASLIGGFAMLSSNVKNNPKRDFVTDKFARGRGTCTSCCFITVPSLSRRCCLRIAYGLILLSCVQSNEKGTEFQGERGVTGQYPCVYHQ
jgi:hypothetical protein